MEATQTPDTRRFRQGSCLGNYSLGRMLGQGAQGVVYLATDVLLQRQVALKVLNPIGPSGSDANQLREARLIANLDHPNVVRVYHVGHNDQAFYMATEFVDGGNLKDLVRRQGPLRPERVLQLAAEATDALAHAHQLGVIHRDIKPQNFLITASGSLKLCDFGLAFQTCLADSSRKVRPVGTPQFMAPEIWAGHPGTRASDLYSLGACIFFMLTGRAPYPSDTLAALERAHCRGQLSLPDTIPPMIQKVIRSCMSINPAERPANASQLGQQIRHVLATSGGDLQTPSVRPPKVPEKRLEPNWEKARQLALALSPFCRQRDQLEDAARLGVPLVVLQGNDSCLRELLLRRIVGPQTQKNLVLAENDESLLQLMARSFDWDGYLETALLKKLQDSPLRLVHLQLKRLPASGEMALLKRIATGLRQNGPMLLVSGSEAWLNAVVLVMEDVSPPILAEIKTRLVLPEEALTFLNNYARHAGGNRIRWTSDALLLACEAVICFHEPIFPLATRALALALENHMRLITSWCVAAALDQVPGPLPAIWPDPATLARLKILRGTQMLSHNPSPIMAAQGT